MSLRIGCRLKVNSKVRLFSQETGTVFSGDVDPILETEIDIRRTAKMERRIQ